MQVPINVKSPNYTSKWQVGFNSAFKGLRYVYNDTQVFCVKDFLLVMLSVLVTVTEVLYLTVYLHFRCAF
jgi:hypothetical protein